MLRHIHQAIGTYVEHSRADRLPSDLNTVKEFLQIRWLTYKEAPYERIKYIGGGRPTNSPPDTVVLLYQYSVKRGQPPRGIARHLNGDTSPLEGDKWLQLWDTSPPTKWE